MLMLRTKMSAIFGGGGGSRTRVRQGSTVCSTCLALLLNLTGHDPTGLAMPCDPD